MDDLKNILNNSDELSEEQLLNYLNGKLSAEEQHAVESSINSSAFISDAVEGLQVMGTETQLEDYVLQLNKKLHKQLETKKTFKNKRKIKFLVWGIMAVLIILLCCIVGYMVIRMF